MPSTTGAVVMKRRPAVVVAVAAVVVKAVLRAVFRCPPVRSDLHGSDITSFMVNYVVKSVFN
jgi:hypothetical protein